MMIMTTLKTGQGERGSALLISLVLILVMAVLGLALFQLGVVEGRLVLTNQDDARAFEIAQVGVERALFRLQNTFNADQTWRTGSALCAGGGHRGCSDSRFYPAASSYISNLNFNSGSYAVEFKQVTATTLSIPCKTDSLPPVPSDVDASKQICDDLIFVRVTGNLAPSDTAPGTAPGYTATRTIQLLAMTSPPSTCLICGGLTGAAATGTPINGNVRIAGSIRIEGKQGSPSLSFGGGAGQTNSYAELDATSLARIPVLPKVCPFGITCTDSDLVESLGATLKVAFPNDVPAVTLSGTAKLGQNGNQTYTGDASRKGKGPLDSLFVADGCSMPCTDNFTGVTIGSNLFVDDNNITKPYQGPAIGFPLLTASWQVYNGGTTPSGYTTYTHLACPQGSSCAPPSTPPTAPTNTEFFVSRAANVMVHANCDSVVSGGVPNTTAGCDPIINSLGSPGSTGGLRDNTQAFTVTVRFFNNADPSVYMKAQICWSRTGVAGLPVQTLEFGQPIPDSTPTPPSWATSHGCDTPAPSSTPLLLYFPSSSPATTGFNIQRNGGPTDYNYRGSAMIVTNGLVTIEERWQTCRTVGSPCASHQFTADSSMTVMTWGGNAGVCAGSASCGNMNLGKDTSNTDRMMGLFYAGCDPADNYCSGNGVTATKGFLTSQKQTNIVGTAMGYRLCFAGGTSPCSSGGNVPSFFQVIPDRNNLAALISVPGGGTFTVMSVPRYWVECKRTLNADGTYQALPNGLCSYTS